MNFKFEYTEEFLVWLEDNYQMFSEEGKTFYISKINGKFNTREQLLDHWFMLKNHK